MAGGRYALTLFDEKHNNPAVTRDNSAQEWMERDGGDLVMELRPQSLVLIESVR